MNSLAVNQVVLRTLSEWIAKRPSEVLDAALIGSVSGHYGWSDTRLSDIDLWVLAENRTAQPVRDWILDVSHDIKAGLEKMASIAYECRAIDGPYKPALSRTDDTVLLHVLLDDETSYQSRGVTTRYSWRKYHCAVDAERLSRLAPLRIRPVDILLSKWGPRVAAECIREGSITMDELDLKSGKCTSVAFPKDSFQFREFCTYVVMMAARNRARADGRIEPDSLSNALFSEWYEALYGDGFVREIVEYKADASREILLSWRFDWLISNVKDWCCEFVERSAEGARK